jgi:phage-related protein
MAETIEYVAADGDTVTLYKVRGAAGRWMPPVHVDDRPVPGDHGTRFRGCRFDAAQPVIPILIEGADPEAYRQALRDVASALNPAKGVGKLRATFDGAVREQSAIYIDGLNHPEDFPLHGQPAVMFRAFDPFWYDTATVVGTFETGTAAPFFPILPIRLASSEVFADAVVDNTGDIEAWPIWTITGPASSLILEHVDSGKQLALDYTLAAGDVVTVDTSPGVKTVTLDDGTNLFPYLSSRQFWPLVRGANNIRVELGGATDDSQVQMVYRRRWLAA